MKTTTHDTYEAAYYILNGGRFASVSFGKLKPNKRSKKGFTTVYRITIDDVQPRYIEKWRTYQAFGNFRDFATTRKKLKKKIDEVRQRKEY